MSLLDDALKRQEELTRTGQKAAKGLPLRNSAPRCRTGQKKQVPPVSPPPENPFLKRERNLPRNTPNFFMPFLALLVLIALIYLRCEFAGKHDRRMTAEELDALELAEMPVNAVPAVEMTNEVAAVPTNAIPAPKPVVTNAPAVKLHVAPAVTNDVAPKTAVTELAAPKPVATNAPSARLAAAPSATNDVAPKTAASAPARATNVAQKAEPPPPLQWPLFTLTGIAVGREGLALLDTGEMLIAGELSRTGVKVVKVASSTVTFSWKGETKTLRKGERSDKMPQQE